MKINVESLNISKLEKSLQNLKFLIEHNRYSRVNTIYTDQSIESIKEILSELNHYRFPDKTIEIKNPQNLVHFYQLFNLLETKQCPDMIEMFMFRQYIDSKKELIPIIDLTNQSHLINKSSIDNLSNNPYINNDKEAKYIAIREKVYKEMKESSYEQPPQLMSFSKQEEESSGLDY
ncbi:hypothetical protein L3V83_09060 [Thiotrichales bacterium 19X7-9]|nr:hypothetical protein [Thiotrichales bacterium 19X7-9]